MTSARPPTEIVFATLARLALVIAAGGVALSLLVAAAECAARAQHLAPADFIWSKGAVLRAIRSLAWAGMIGAIATTLGALAGFAIASMHRRVRGAIAPAALLPCVLPSYLAYAGWGLARSPGTRLGDWLLAAKPPWFTSDVAFWPVLASKVQAVLGLSLWAWPVAGVWVALACVSSDASIGDALRLEARSFWSRQRVRLMSVQGSVIGAFACVTLLMLGSTTPMHLAQLDTLSIKAWLALAQSPPGEYFRAWAGTWPVVVVAVAFAWWWARRALHVRTATIAEGPSAGRGALGVIPVSLLLCASVLVPAALFAASVRDWHALTEFITGTYAGALRQSVIDSAASGAIGALACVALASWSGVRVAQRSARFSWAGRRAWAAHGLCATFALLVLGTILPGVLIGSALARAGHWTERATGWAPLAGSVVVIGMLARAGAIIAVAAWWTGLEARASVGDLQRLDGADRSPLRWLMSSPRHVLGACAACGLLVAAVSLHETEATVMTLPTGTGNLAWAMLQFLHLLRDDMLGAGVLVVTGLSLAAAIVAGVVGGRVIRR